MDSEVNGKVSKLTVKSELRAALEDKLKLLKILKKCNLRDKNSNTDNGHKLVSSLETGNSSLDRKAQNSLVFTF